ncbi:MAG: chromate resistance protein [Candidatus Tectomicrobia bacterium]|uniref:Chromate resistance protein n=1 Tax=Tectimicrobiota bacterium TaxID=2528274 RepID=A0A932LYK0_UNCTE|nr:chromate resistance protein [Candidatus Tectomicrobia bacterium]
MKRDKSLRWLLFIFQLPAQPSKARVSLWRRLQKIGAIGLKNSAYVLPFSQETIEDFQWLKEEVLSARGTAQIFTANAVQGMKDEEIRGLFLEARSQDYKTLGEELGRLQLGEELGRLQARAARLLREKQLNPAAASGLAEQLERLQKQYQEIKKIDFFGAPQGSVIEKQIRSLRGRLSATESRPTGRTPSEQGKLAPLSIPSLKGKPWVTRANIHIDRLATAWLVLRFIDPNAPFTFIDPQAEKIPPGSIRFDMFEAEFGHTGDLCTFETLLWRLGFKDRALTEIAEIVHDVDLKDGKFFREEGPGLDRILSGLGRLSRNDHEHLQKSLPIFDGLYSFFKEPGKRPKRPQGTTKTRLAGSVDQQSSP